jgi:hypothetical protein
MVVTERRLAAIRYRTADNIGIVDVARVGDRPAKLTVRRHWFGLAPTIASVSQRPGTLSLRGGLKEVVGEAIKNWDLVPPRQAPTRGELRRGVQVEVWEPTGATVTSPITPITRDRSAHPFLEFFPVVASNPVGEPIYEGLVQKASAESGPEDALRRAVQDHLVLSSDGAVVARPPEAYPSQGSHPQ